MSPTLRARAPNGATASASRATARRSPRGRGASSSARCSACVQTETRGGAGRCRPLGAASSHEAGAPASPRRKRARRTKATLLALAAGVGAAQERARLHGVRVSDAHVDYEARKSVRIVPWVAAKGAGAERVAGHRSLHRVADEDRTDGRRVEAAEHELLDARAGCRRAPER